MLISISTLTSKYNLKIKGILHIGAHHLEEKNSYHNIGVTNIVWIEGCKTIFEKGKQLHPNEILYNEVISDVDNQEVEFIVTNNGESSSILELQEHLKEHPHIHEVRRDKVKTKTLATFINENNIDISNLNFMNIDIQGNELRALKGLGDQLNNFEYLYLEVNTKHLYKDGALLHDLDKYLEGFGFKRVELSMTQHGWGDAFYIKI